MHLLRGAASAPAPVEPEGRLIAALRARLRAGVDNPLLRNRSACVVLLTEDEAVTIRLDRGQLRAQVGAAPARQR